MLYEVITRGNADVSRWSVAEFADRLDFRLDLFEPRCDPKEKALAGLGQGDAACGARQQTDAETRLELADGVAERGLRDADLRGRLGEASLLRHGEEREEAVDVLFGHGIGSRRVRRGDLYIGLTPVRIRNNFV